jgi:competence protein ComEC
MKKPLFNRLTATFLSIVLLQIIFIIQKKDTHNKSEFIVFQSKKNTIISERVGDLVSIQSNDSILETIDDNLLIQSYLVGNFCKIKSKKSIENLIYFNSHKIMIIDSSGIYSTKIKPDILIIVQSPKINFQRLLTIYKPKEVVVDGSNYKSYVKLWEATCRKEKIPFHYTNEKGFYKI